MIDVTNSSNFYYSGILTIDVHFVSIELGESVQDSILKQKLRLEDISQLHPLRNLFITTKIIIF